MELALLGALLALLADHTVQARQPRPQFTDVAAKSTFTYVTRNDFKTRKYFIQPLSGGVAILDYDNDGWLDVYVTNITDEYMKECNMLWHNNHDGTFTDVSRETGTCETLWGWAAKFGDYDNDGLLDLFVVNGLRSAGPENYIPVLVDLITKPGVDFTDVRGWPNIGGMTWSGYQKKKFFQIGRAHV